MSEYRHDGRRFEPLQTAVAVSLDDGRVELRSPGVGLWRSAPPPGTLITAGADVGELEVLGVLHRLVAPVGVRGVVVAGNRIDRPARRPVAHGEVLVTLSPQGAGAGDAATGAGDAGALDADPDAGGALSLRAPSSGRFYARPAPGKPAFVSVGDVIAAGQTVCLLEVMKTFNRVSYGGPGLPERARVTAIVPGDEQDLDAGDVILWLEPAS